MLAHLSTRAIGRKRLASGKLFGSDILDNFPRFGALSYESLRGLQSSLRR